MEQYDKAIDGLAACIAALFDQAMLVAEDYWNFVNKMEGRQTGRDSKSSLQLSCQLKGNHIEAKWSGIKWYGQKASRYSLRVPIPKSKTTSSYAKNKLKEFAKEWEWDKVCEAEEKLTAIRRQQHHVKCCVHRVRRKPGRQPRCNPKQHQRAKRRAPRCL